MSSNTCVQIMSDEENIMSKVFFKNLFSKYMLYYCILN